MLGEHTCVSGAEIELRVCMCILLYVYSLYTPSPVDHMFPPYLSDDIYIYIYLNIYLSLYIYISIYMFPPYLSDASPRRLCT